MTILVLLWGAKTNPDSGTVNYWYYNNIETKNDTNGNSYSDYIEDTIYCNDRSFNNYAESGWNPDGGDTTKYLYFGSYGRSSNPSVTCPRNIDKLTVASGYLKYPTGLLTEDEIRLAGASNSTNYNYYLWNGTPGTTTSSTATYWWSASPHFFNGSSASGLLVCFDASSVLPSALLAVVVVGFAWLFRQRRRFRVERERRWRLELRRRRRHVRRPPCRFTCSWDTDRWRRRDKR